MYDEMTKNELDQICLTRVRQIVVRVNVCTLFFSTRTKKFLLRTLSCGKSQK